LQAFGFEHSEAGCKGRSLSVSKNSCKKKHFTWKIHSDTYETFTHKRRAKRDIVTWCYVYNLKITMNEAQIPLILTYFRELKKTLSLGISNKRQRSWKLGKFI